MDSKFIVAHVGTDNAGHESVTITGCDKIIDGTKRIEIAESVGCDFNVVY